MPQWSQIRFLSWCIMYPTAEFQCLQRAVSSLKHKICAASSEPRLPQVEYERTLKDGKEKAVSVKPVVFTRRRPTTHDVCVTYPQRVVVVEGVEQLDDVAMVTFGQDVNLHHVVLQLIFTLGLDLLGGGQSSGLLVPGLRQRKGRTLKSNSFLRD